jgi:hypothetical protein
MEGKKGRTRKERKEESVRSKRKGRGRGYLINTK